MLEFHAHFDQERDLVENGFLKLVDPLFEDNQFRFIAFLLPGLIKPHMFVAL